jgi:hypothetical protein
MRITRLVLHTVFAVLVGTALVLASAPTWAAPAGPRAALGGLGGGVRRPGRAGDCSGARARALVAYLVVLVAVLAVVAAVEPSLLFLMFLAYPAGLVLRRGRALRRRLVGGGRGSGVRGPLVAAARGTSPCGGRGRRWSACCSAWPWGCGCPGDRAQRPARLAHPRARAHPGRAGHGRARARGARRARAAGPRGARHPGAGLHEHRRPGADRGRAARRPRVPRASGWASSRRSRGTTWPRPAPWWPRSGRSRSDDATLVEALERLADRFARETGLAVRVDTAALGRARRCGGTRRSCCCAGRAGGADQRAPARGRPRRWCCGCRGWRAGVGARRGRRRGLRSLRGLRLRSGGAARPGGAGRRGGRRRVAAGRGHASDVRVPGT